MSKPVPMAPGAASILYNLVHFANTVVTPRLERSSLAFEIVDHVPPNCFTLCVDDDRHAPHLQPGELVIVDPSDREYRCGEVFAVQQLNGPAIWEVRPNKWPGLHPRNRASGCARSTGRAPRKSPIG